MITLYGDRKRIQAPRKSKGENVLIIAFTPRKQDINFLVLPSNFQNNKYPVVSHVSLGWGVVDQTTPVDRPGGLPTPPDADLTGCRTPSSGCRPTPLVMWPVVHDGKPNLPPPCPPRTEGMIHACRNITLSQTSFAGGKNTKQSPTHGQKRSVHSILMNLPPNRTLFHLGVSGAPTRSRNPWTDAFNAEYRVSWNKTNLHVTMHRQWVQGVLKQGKPSC